MPAAVDRGLVCAFAPAKDAHTRVVSIDLPGCVELGPDRMLLDGSPSFGTYVEAVAFRLATRGIEVPGMSVAVASTIPAGGGMSSSAALCVALTLSMAAGARADLDPLDVALISQEAEHYVGVKCGLMDQYAIAFGKRGHALLLDTRRRSHQEVPVELDGWVFVVGDTKKSRGLVDSEYNARRKQVEEAARELDEGNATIESLRDVTPDFLKSREDNLSPLLYRRARHVVEENSRTVAAARLLESSDEGDTDSLVKFLGSLLDASHASLRDLFEVSCPELNALVTALRDQGDHRVAGARMMGGGFGGCVIALARKNSLDEALDRAAADYESKTGLHPEFFPVELSDGARVLES